MKRRKKRTRVKKEPIDQLLRDKNSQLNGTCKTIKTRINELVDRVRDDLRVNNLPTTQLSCSFEILNPISGEKHIYVDGRPPPQNLISIIKQTHQHPLENLLYVGTCTRVPILEGIVKMFLCGKTWIRLTTTKDDFRTDADNILCSTTKQLESKLNMGPLVVDMCNEGAIGQLFILNNNSSVSVSFPLINTVETFSQHFFLFKNTPHEITNPLLAGGTFSQLLFKNTPYAYESPQYDVYQVSLHGDKETTRVESKSGGKYVWEFAAPLLEYDADSSLIITGDGDVSVPHSYHACKKYIPNWFLLLQNITRCILEPLFSERRELNLLLGNFYNESQVSASEFSEIDTVLLDIVRDGDQKYSVLPAIFLPKENKLSTLVDTTTPIVILFTSVFKSENFFILKNQDAYSVSVCNIKFE